jgi:hypothetical protein
VAVPAPAAAHAPLVVDDEQAQPPRLREESLRCAKHCAAGEGIRPPAHHWTRQLTGSPSAHPFLDGEGALVEGAIVVAEGALR